MTSIHVHFISLPPWHVSCSCSLSPWTPSSSPPQRPWQLSWNSRPPETSETTEIVYQSCYSHLAMDGIVVVLFPTGVLPNLFPCVPPHFSEILKDKRRNAFKTYVCTTKVLKQLINICVLNEHFIPIKWPELNYVFQLNVKNNSNCNF